MNKLSALLALAAVSVACTFTSAGIIYEDDFSTYGSDVNIASSASWNATWMSGDATQRNLFRTTAAGDSATINMQNAKSQYRALAQTGFSFVGGESATVETQLQYTHNGQGAPNVFNSNFFGLIISDQPQWWNGGNSEINVANRGPALGNTLPGPPWVENWTNHSVFGVDYDGGAQSTSGVIDVKLTLTPNASTGNYRAILEYGGMTSSAIDTGFAIGSTIYAGYSVGWDGFGGTKADATGIDTVIMDNFVITTIPEPSSLSMLGLLGLAAIRRKK